jgi:hypothetical protein
LPSGSASIHRQCSASAALSTAQASPWRSRYYAMKRTPWRRPRSLRGWPRSCVWTCRLSTSRILRHGMGGRDQSERLIAVNRNSGRDHPDWPSGAGRENDEGAAFCRAECKQRSGVGRPPRSTDSIGELSTWQYLPIFPLMDQPRLFALRLGPLDHVDMPAVDALKQQDRWESVVEPGQLPGELHARRATTTDQPRLWLVVHA